MNDKQKAESYRRDLEKRIDLRLQVVQLNKRIRELELALLDVKAGSDEPHILQIVEEALEPPR